MPEEAQTERHTVRLRGTDNTDCERLGDRDKLREPAGSHLTLMLLPHPPA